MVRDPEEKKGEWEGKNGGFFCYRLAIGGPSHAPVDGAEWEYMKEQLSKT